MRGFGNAENPNAALNEIAEEEKSEDSEDRLGLGVLDDPQSDNVLRYTPNWSDPSASFSMYKKGSSSSQINVKQAEGMIDPKVIEDDKMDLSCSFTSSLKSISEKDRGDEFDEESIALVFPRRILRQNSLTKELSPTQQSNLEESKAPKFLSSDKDLSQYQEKAAGVKRALTVKYVNLPPLQKTNFPLQSKFSSQMTKRSEESLKKETAEHKYQASFTRENKEKKNAKVFDNPEYEMFNPMYPREYEATDSELQLRQTLYQRQTREKKARALMDLQNNVLDKLDTKGLNDSGRIEPTEADNEEERAKQDLANINIANIYYSIRESVNEKFIPASLKYVNVLIILLGILVLSIAIADFVISDDKNSEFERTIPNIALSNRRFTHLYQISMLVSDIIIYLAAYEEYDDTLAGFSAELLSESVIFNKVHLELIQSLDDFSTQQKIAANPISIKLQYMNFTKDLDDHYNLTLTQALLEYRLIAIRVDWYVWYVGYGLPNEATEDDPFIYILRENMLNSLLIAIEESCAAILQQVKDSKDGVMDTFFLLLIIATVAVGVSILILNPMIILVKKERDEVLKLFLHIPLEEMKKYKLKCERFQRCNRTVSLKEAGRILRSRKS